MSPTTLSPSPSSSLPHPFTLTSPPPTLLTQGAEAHLYLTYFLTPTHPSALKHRPSKPYRHPILDRRLTKHRLLSEARTLVKCRREGVAVPGVLALDAEAGWMMMEWVGGRTVRDVILGVRKGGGGKEGEVRGLMGKVGRAVGRMHEVGVVHGDLTTSNMMLRPPGFGSGLGPAMSLPLRDDGLRSRGMNGDGDGGEDGARVAEEEEEKEEGLEGDIVLIDFGLAGQSLQDEDKAVDLYVLERAFGSTHPEAEEGFQEVLRAYGESYKGAKVVLKRLEDVRMRGRKRTMVG